MRKITEIIIKTASGHVYNLPARTVDNMEGFIEYLDDYGRIKPQITKVIHDGLSKADLIEWLDGEIEKNCKLYEYYEIDNAFFETLQLRKQKETFEKVKQHIESMEDAPIAEATVDTTKSRLQELAEQHQYILTQIQVATFALRQIEQDIINESR